MMVSVWASAIVAQSPSRRIPLAIPADPAAERQLAGILHDWENDEFDRVREGISRLFANHADALISTENGQILRGSLIVEVLLARLPAAVRDELTSMPGFQERERARLTVSSPEEAELLLQQADAHWRLGELTTARRIWSLLAPLHPKHDDEYFWQFPVPAPSLEPAVRARLSAADALHGRRRSASFQLTLLKERSPDAEGDLAGRSGTYSSILETVLEETRQAPDETFLPTPGSNWLPFQPGRVDLLSREWRASLLENEESGVSRASWRPATSVSRPVVWGEVVLIQDATGVRALKLDSGTSAWPFGENDPGLLIPDAPVAAMPLPPARVHVPDPSRSGSVHRDRWFGRLGPNWISPAALPDGTTESRIVALDLSAEGRLQWTRSIGEFPGAAPRSGHIFSGEPLSDGNGRVYVPIRERRPGDQLSLVCLDASSGETEWIVEVGSLLTAASERPVRGSDRLRIEGDRLLWNIDGRAVVGLDPADGSWDWLTALPGSGPPTPEQRLNDLHAEPGRIYALSPGGITALDPVTGAVAWSTELAGSPHHILGVADDMLILAGRELWGVNRFSGAIAWRRGGEHVARSGQGRGLLLGRSILWPTRDELWTVDAFTGQLRQRDFVMQLSQTEGGHLTLTDRFLLVTGPDQVTAFRILVAPP